MPEVTVTFGRFIFDLDTQELMDHASRATIPLQPRPSLVLSILIKQAGTLVTREQLYRAGWGDTTATWAGPGALMMRVEVAQQIANRMGNAMDPREVARQVLPDGLSENTATAIARAEQPSTGMALLFSSPCHQ